MYRDTKKSIPGETIAKKVKLLPQDRKREKHRKQKNNIHEHRIQ